MSSTCIRGASFSCCPGKFRALSPLGHVGAGRGSGQIVVLPLCLLRFHRCQGEAGPRGAASELLGLAGWLGRQAGGTWGRGAGDGRALGVPGWLGLTAALDPVAATAADPVSE